MKQSVVIVNIASGDPDLLNLKTIRTLKGSRQLLLRTSRSPIVKWLESEDIAFCSLDGFYETVEDFDQLYMSIADHIWSCASHSQVVYAVADLMEDRSVTALFERRPENGVIEIVPGIGTSDIFQPVVRPYLDDSDFRRVSASDFLLKSYNPEQTVLITELDNEILTGEVKLLLSSVLEDEHEVLFIQNLSGAVLIPLFELDRKKDINHLSSVLVPGSGYLERNRFVLEDLLRIMERLRSSDGCPWDRIQTHQSLRPYMIEEAWECVASIDENDTDHLAEELGDLLFQIVFHSSIGNSFDEFTMNDVISHICRKMIRRHPHVFTSCTDYSTQNWETIKQTETGNLSAASSLNDVSGALPSLKYAAKALKKSYGIPALKKSAKQVAAEICRILSPSESGDSFRESDLENLLFHVSELCFLNHADSELLLHHAVDRYIDVIKAADQEIKKDGKAIECLTFAELGVYLKHVEGEIK